MRKTVLPYWSLVLAASLGLAIAGALFAGKVYADEPTIIAKDPQGNWIRLRDEPCPDVPDWMKLRKAEMFYQGKVYGACWRVEKHTVLVFDDNGDFSVAPVQAFQKDEPPV